MADAIRRSEKPFTYMDYCGWPDDERWELIDGVAYNMSPAPSTRHQLISGELFRQIADFLVGKKCNAFPAPFDVRLPGRAEQKDEEVDTVVQPDIVVVCDRKKLDDKGCRGAPDWIIEILSPGTAVKDLKIKQALYERHRVHELWFVHPTDKTVMIFRLGKDGSYGKPLFLDESDKAEPAVLAGLSIDLKTVLKEET